jgi:hypothetical protein
LIDDVKAGKGIILLLYLLLKGRQKQRGSTPCTRLTLTAAAVFSSQLVAIANDEWMRAMHEGGQLSKDERT